MSYEDAARAMAAKAALWALPLLDENKRPEALGSIALETCGRLRTLGILALLAQGNEQQFFKNLSRSVRAWALYLRRAATADPRPHHFVSGRIDPILDGIAAGDWEAIGWIESTAPAERQGRSEYEDDFCYARLLLGMANENTGKEALGPWLERLGQFDDGARFAACAALLERDPPGLETALSAVIVLCCTDTAGRPSERRMSVGVLQSWGELMSRMERRDDSTPWPQGRDPKWLERSLQAAQLA